MKKKVLVVEDEIIVAMDLQAILIDLGYEVPAILTSGEAAVQQAPDLMPDLVLMDIHLSESLDGIDAAATIAQTLAIPVVYLTAYADEETLRRARETAPFGYILKPFEAKELKANLEIAFYKHGIEKVAQEDRQWLLAVLNSISEAVVASNGSGKIQFMNPVAEALTGWTQAEAVQHPLHEVFTFVDGQTSIPFEASVRQALDSGQTVRWPEGTLLRSKDGLETPVAYSISPIASELGGTTGSVMVFRDITTQKRNQEQLEYSALHDTLTDLPNRVLFLDRLQQAIDRAKRSPHFGFAVMLIDLDRFKVINDTLGHLVGDQLLMAIAPRFQAHLRAVDTVARLGGDEFAILLEDVHDTVTTKRMAERILEDLERPFEIASHELLVSASIGIVMSCMPYKDITDLLKHADIAMYRAKAQGRGRYEMFNMAMHQQTQQFLLLEHDLQQAIAHHMLQVHYQPIVSLQTHQVVSVEALVRWQNRQGVLVPPTAFIPMAEEVGLITALDRWVLNTSCRQLQTWQQRFGNQDWQINPTSILHLSPASLSAQALATSVNLSSRQFCQQNWVENFIQTLKATGLRGDCLKIEITESVFMENADTAATTLRQLKDLGVQIHLDDFGTGYSSLSYLHKFPIDVVKIDQSFIQGLATDHEKLEIVRGIIGLCHSLKMTVTAEGIETSAQAEILTSLGCEYGQGYLFSPPLTGDTITELLANG